MIINEMVFMLVCAAVAITGGIGTAYQLYQIVKLDAGARGIKNPKFWGVWAMNGNNSSGLVLYLLIRRKYPIVNMSEDCHREIETRKKRSFISLIFLTVGGIGMVIFISFM